MKPCIEIKNGLENRVAVCIMNPDDRTYGFCYRENESIEIGSTFKAILLAKAVKLIEQHYLNEDHSVQIKPEYICGSSPIFGNCLGETVTLKSLLLAMMGKSDNTATDAVLDIINGIEDNKEGDDLVDHYWGTIPKSIRSIYETNQTKAAICDARRVVGFFANVDGYFSTDESRNMFWHYMEQEEIAQPSGISEKVKLYRKGGFADFEKLGHWSNIAGAIQRDNKRIFFCINSGRVYSYEEKTDRLFYEFVRASLNECIDYVNS